MCNTRFLVVVLGLLLAGCLSGCARTYVDKEADAFSSEQHISFPAYSGPKTVVAVLPLGLSRRAADRYPQLLKKSVGFGVHNELVEALYDTHRFRFVEEKPDIIKDVMDRQWMSAAGMVSQSKAIELGRVLGASKVIYGEVYDFAQGGESIGPGGVSRGFNIRMAVQVRFVDVETLEYVPGSGTGYGRSVGEASRNAIRAAVLKLIKRL